MKKGKDKIIAFFGLSIFFLFNISSVSFAGTDPLLRQTKYGAVKGIAYESWFEDEKLHTYAWLGIPYAKPPIGELRWKAPREPEKWSGIKETKEFSSACTQFGGLMSIMDCEKIGELIGTEDCLYLNIWRPRTEEKGLPVFFWIHGGGNCVGQSAMSLYNGANLSAKTNMVVVSINYRLGPMGWFTHPALATGDPLDDSGNYGTLDLIQALKWVKENIANFGGDPNNVTIAGESAGGMNVYSLLASPLAKGLFHKAISESGAPMAVSKAQGEKRGQWLLSQLLIKDGLAQTEEEAKSYLQDKDNEWIAKYLRSKSAEEIYSCYEKGPFGTLGKMEISRFIFRRGEGDGLGGTFIDGTVLVEDIKESLKKGNYNQVPFIVGSNKEEGKLFLPLMLSFVTEQELCQKSKEIDPDHPNVKISDYLKNPLYYPIYEPLGRLLGKGFQMMGVEAPAKMMSNHQDHIYVYRFDWDDEPKPLDFIFGAMHGMELPFVFGNFQKDQNSVLRFAWSEKNKESRLELANRMMSYWSNFAKTGDPNSPGLPVWNPWSNRPGDSKPFILDSK